MSRPHSPLGQLVVGMTILFVGLLWTLDAMDVAETGDLIRWWPMGLVFLGALKLFGLGVPKSPVAGILLLGFGMAFTLDSVGVLEVSFKLFWPMAS